MKYQCVGCKKIVDADDVVIAGINTGWGFFTSTVFCNSCFELYEKSKKSCLDCKYQKTKRKNEPCKSCKEHSNWES